MHILSIVYCKQAFKRKPNKTSKSHFSESIKRHYRLMKITMNITYTGLKHIYKTDFSYDRY